MWPTADLSRCSPHASIISIPRLLFEVPGRESSNTKTAVVSKERGARRLARPAPSCARAALCREAGGTSAENGSLEQRLEEGERWGSPFPCVAVRPRGTAVGPAEEGGPAQQWRGGGGGVLLQGFSSCRDTWNSLNATLVTKVRLTPLPRGGRRALGIPGAGARVWPHRPRAPAHSCLEVSGTVPGPVSRPAPWPVCEGLSSSDQSVNCEQDESFHPSKFWLLVLRTERQYGWLFLYLVRVVFSVV